MARKGFQRQLALRPSASAATTPASSAYSTPTPSAYPSAYPSEDEGEEIRKIKPFAFLSLPSELRTKIYDLAFAASPEVIDLEPSTFRIFQRTQLFSLFRVCRQVHREATHQFFSTHTFRIFPTFPGKFFKTKRPMIARIPSRYRESITTLELRLGPGWNNPPRGWIVNDALGLKDCTGVRVLKVFVECDPSEEVFRGFRKSEGFYENFCADLLREVLKEIPSVTVVEFDAYNSVSRTGDMMAGLGEIVAEYDKVVSWGPERGWAEESDQVWLDAILMNGGNQRSSNASERGWVEDSGQVWLDHILINGGNQKLSKSRVVFS